MIDIQSIGQLDQFAEASSQFLRYIIYLIIFLIIYFCLKDYLVADAANSHSQFSLQVFGF